MIFSFKFFYMNKFPLTPEHPNRTFLNFCRKIRGDIREWMFIDGVNDDKRENIEVPYNFFMSCRVPPPTSRVPPPTREGPRVDI